MGWDTQSAEQQPSVIRETSCHGVVSHEPTMGSLATGSWENAPNSRTAVRCLQG